MRARVYLSPEGDRIRVDSDPGFLEACKLTPTRRWVATSRVWEFSASPWVAHRLALNLEDAPGARVELSDEVDALRRQAITVASIIEVANSAPIVKNRRARFAPWRHQFIGATLIRRLRAVYLGWEMGTGKTKGVIDSILDLSDDPRCFFPVLIVCPASVVDVWAREFPKHVEDLSEIEVVPSRQKDTVAKRVDKAREAYDRRRREGGAVVIVTNYESFFLDSSPFLKWAQSVRWEMIVPDEAHRLATPGSKTTKAIGRIAENARRRVFLSGTPMRNSPLDLYSQCRILDPGIFGANQREFLDRYAVLDFWGNVVGIQNTEELSTAFGVIAHRIDKRKVLDLPPVTISTRRFDLSSKGRAIYEDLAKNLAIELDRGTVDVANAIVRLLRLQQITSGYLPVVNEAGVESFEEIDDEKFKALAEIVGDVSIDEPIVVFCRFRKDLETVREVARLNGRTSFELSGQENSLAAWQSDRTGSIIAVQIQAGGIGVDLTRSALTIFYSIGFSLADYEQAKARVDRPGQSRPVSLVNLIARDTVDEAVFGSITSKGNVVESVLDYIRKAAR